MPAAIENTPFIPDRHGDLQDIGTLSHAQLEQTITTLTSRVNDLETELMSVRSKPVQHIIIQNLPPGSEVIDLEPYGIQYAPGTNTLLMWANCIKQWVVDNYTELSATTVGLTAPSTEGDVFEIYVLPIPVILDPGP